MAIVVSKNGGSGVSDSSPLLIVVRGDTLPNNQVRDGTTLSASGSWTDRTIKSPQWTVVGPAGAVQTSSLTCDPSWTAKSCMQFVVALPGTYVVTLSAQQGSKQIENSAEFNVVAISTVQNAVGKLTLLRAHEQGSKYGPPNDELDVEVVAALDSKPGLAFGLQLRADDREPAHRAMFDLLRDAYARDLQISIDYWKHNGVILRVWLAKS